MSQQQVNNPTSSSLDSGPVDEETQKRRGIIAFVGTMTFSIIVIVMFFSIGSIFLSQADFYSRYKMTGRFPNGPPYTTEFPYKNLFTESKSDSWAYRYMRWLTDSMIKAFSENRYLLDMFFDYLGKGLDSTPGFVSTLVLIFAPIIMLAMVVITYFAGVIMTLVGAVTNLGEVLPTFFEFALLALPFCIPLIIYPFFLIISAGVLGTGVGIAQMLMMIGFLIVLPLTDAGVRQGIINTLLENKYAMLVCIFSVMTFQAFTLLNKTYGYISLGIAIASLITYIFLRVL